MDEAIVPLLILALTACLVSAAISSAVAFSTAQQRCETYHADMIYKDAVKKCEDILRGKPV